MRLSERSQVRLRILQMICGGLDLLSQRCVATLTLSKSRLTGSKALLSGEQLLLRCLQFSEVLLCAAACELDLDV